MSFEANDWRNICEAAAAEAGRRCGSSYEMFVQFYSELVDARLLAIPSGDHDQALAIARETGDYLTADELASEKARYVEEGYCSHGFDHDCCPLGCGDLE